MNLSVVLPILLPLATAALCLIAWNRSRLQRGISVTGAILHFVASLFLAGEVAQGGAQILAVGGWRAPFGIVLVADTLAAILVVLTSLLGLVVILDSLRSASSAQESFGYFPLVHVLLMGVSGAFLTGDLFNLYVWFEVLLISSFVLLSLGAERAQLEASLKYVTLNLIASAIFLCALGLLYGTYGTLNLADLALRVSEGQARGFGLPLSMMFLVAFGLKAGLVPLHSWLPASYHTPPVNVSALFAGLLTKVGVVALIRIFSVAFRFDLAATDTILEVMAALTMILGGLGALVQNDLRRMLAFLVMNGVGAMVFGLACHSAMGTAATVLYLIHSVVASAAAFLLAGQIQRVAGTYDLRQMGGLASSQPRLHTLWLIVSLTLVGVPPFSGFFGKYALFRAGIATGHEAGVLALALSSVLTLAAVLRVWQMAFAREKTLEGAKLRISWSSYALVALVVGFGAFLNPLSAISARVGEELANPEDLSARVLEAKP